MTLDELGERVKAIRAELEAKAAAGDSRARRLLTELYGHPSTVLVDVPADPPKHWQEAAEDHGHEDAGE